MANVSLCGSTSQNTGQILCDISKGVGKGLYIFNGSVAAGDYATQALFEAKMIANSKLSRTAANKVFPIPEIQDIVDSSEANTEGSLGLGFKAIIREGRPVYTLKMFAGSTLAKKLRKYNNQTIRILELDANNRIWGTKQGTAFVGYLAQVFFTGQKMATGQSVEEGIVTCTLSILNISEYNDNSFYQDITNVSSIVGLLDVDLTETVAHTSNVYKIGVSVPTSQIGKSVNLYDQLSVLLASASLWSAKTGATFSTTLAITSVAADAVNSGFTVTFDSTAFTALSAGAKIQLSLVAPETLDAADVTNIESNPIVLTK